MPATSCGRISMIALSRLVTCLLLCALGATGFAGCVTKPNPVMATPAKNTVSFAQRSASFGIDLFKSLCDPVTPENMVLSPFSVTEALAMALNGAAGETLDAMNRVLELDGLTLAEMNAASKELCAILLGADPTRQLLSANSVWLRDGYRFDEAFVDAVKDAFAAEAKTLDFTSPRSVNKVNDWVKGKTKGKIESILDSIGPNDLAYLVNAIYLKADWSHAFDPNKTSDARFTTPSSQVTVKMMRRKAEYAYLSGDGFQSVRIPYGGGSMAMYVFLPDEEAGLSDFVEAMTAADWNRWMESYDKKTLSLGMPRFTVKYETLMNDALKAMGMDIAFDCDRADFRGMSSSKDRNPGIYISKVTHKGFIAVGEKGTEAAAATGVVMGTTSMPLEPELSVVLNRPFFYAIRDDVTGAVLFMGTVVDPS